MLNNKEWQLYREFTLPSAHAVLQRLQRAIGTRTCFGNHRAMGHSNPLHVFVGNHNWSLLSRIW